MSSWGVLGKRYEQIAADQKRRYDRGCQFIGAGADTTLIAILAVLGALLHHPME